MLFEQPFTKDNLDNYLKELAKEFRKINGKNMPADIILIGGASVVINYGFREMTYDMDAVINFLNAHHFDYRGLIEKGLALEAPKDMYKF